MPGRSGLRHDRGMVNIDFSLLDVPRLAPVDDPEAYLRAAIAWHISRSSSRSPSKRGGVGDGWSRRAVASPLRTCGSATAASPSSSPNSPRAAAWWAMTRKDCSGRRRHIRCRTAPPQTTDPWKVRATAGGFPVPGLWQPPDLRWCPGNNRCFRSTSK